MVVKELLHAPGEVALSAADERLFGERREHGIRDARRFADRRELLRVLDGAQLLDESAARNEVETGLGERLPVRIGQGGRLEADPPVELLGDRPNVVVTRTFSKAFALAGLRVGYCIASPDVAGAVRKCQVPFSVSGLAFR